MNADHDAALRQELLEYLFDCHPDPARIEALLRDDAHARKLLDEEQKVLQTFKQAAKEAAPEVTFTPPTDSHSTPPKRPRPILRLWSWRLAAGFALCLGGIPLAVWGTRSWQRNQLQEQSLRLVVSGPPGITDGAAGQFRIETWDLDGNVQPAQVNWTAQNKEGETLATGALECNGAVDLTTPAHLEGIRQLNIVADANGIQRSALLDLRPDVEAPLAHISTDKSAYQPGETLYARAVLLDRISLAPREGRFRFRIVDGKGVALQQQTLPTEQGVVSMSWDIPDDAPGSEYFLELRNPNDEWSFERAKFLVRRYQPPRLATTIELDQETYAPGETGRATVRVERLAGGNMEGASVRASLVVDGNSVWTEDSTLDASGGLEFSFSTPDFVERGEARFVARVVDGGIVESAMEPFVIPLGTLHVEFFPEGGDLVAGVENRVYAEVTDALGRPAHARGEIVDSAGAVISSFETSHQGRGRFTLTPVFDRSYSLQFDAVDLTPIPLPEAKRDGVVLRTASDATRVGESVRATVHVPSPGPWIAGIFCRGVLTSQDAFQGSGKHDVELTVPDEIAGVLRLTVFDDRLQPVAERLVHRQSGRRIAISIDPDRPQLAPGEHQRVKIQTTDENGQPVAAVVGLAVTDRAVRDYADEYRIGLCDQTWLFADVHELEDAGEFVVNGPEAEERIDLLLGTRGWRRFAWFHPQQFQDEHADDARRLLARIGTPQIPVVTDQAGDSRQRIRVAEQKEWKALQALILGGLALGLVLIGSIFIDYIERWIRPLLKRPALSWSTASALSLAAMISPLFFLTWLQSQAPTADHVFLGAAAAPVPQADGLDVLQRDVLQDKAMLEADVVRFAGQPERWEFWRANLAKQNLPVLVEELAREDRNEPEAERELELGRRDVLRRLGYVVENKLQQRIVPSGFMQTRVYAHRRTSEAARSDFTETVYWNSLLQTSAMGEATVVFDLSDRITTWVVWADAHGHGRVGQSEASFVSVPALRAEAVLPIETTVGDRLRIPIALTAVDQNATEAVCEIASEGPLHRVNDGLVRVPLVDGRGRTIVDIDVRSANEDGRLKIIARTGNAEDQVAQTIRVVPRGFPHRTAKSGQVGEFTEFFISVPDEYTPGSFAASLRVYPSPLADLMQGMDGILREPCGCFEQASSSNYPNVLALRYAQAAGIDNAEFRSRCRSLLERGYKKIAGYECSEKGFEWFGANPGHEALTAYGLLEFHDMSAVFPVHAPMVDRTRDWLLDRRDGDGGYLRNDRALDSFGRAPAAVTDAYATYALAVTGTPKASIDQELKRLGQRGMESDDPYEVALAANGVAEHQPDQARAIRARLRTMQKDDGSLCGSTTSITSSGGTDLAVETTSFAILAWLHDANDAAPVERAVQFLLENRRSGGTFGASQATIMALKALTAYAQTRRAIAQPGTLSVFVDDFLVETMDFEAGHQDPIAFENLVEHLPSGPHRIRLGVTGGNELPWSFEMSYHSDQPADDPECALVMRTDLDVPTVEEGSPVSLRTEIANVTDKGVPMVLAIIGIPAGLEVPTKVLNDLREAKRFDLWEIRGRELILYWRGLAARESRVVNLDLIARVPGTTTGPASRIGLYYTPDSQRWSAPLRVEVTPAR